MNAKPVCFLVSIIFSTFPRQVFERRTLLNNCVQSARVLWLQFYAQKQLILCVRTFLYRFVECAIVQNIPQIDCYTKIHTNIFAFDSTVRIRRLFECAYFKPNNIAEEYVYWWRCIVWAFPLGQFDAYSVPCQAHTPHTHTQSAPHR